MAAIDTVLVKVASRCNLNCSYCYVFNMGDEAWRRQPKRLETDTLASITDQLAELLARQNRPFSVVLHGGEPLLLGPRRLGDLFSTFRSNLPGCGVHLQTNGLLLTRDVVDVIATYEVGVSVSLDGPGEVNDEFRVDHRGRGSFDRILAGVELLRSHPKGAELFSGYLAVIDPRTNPVDIYSFFKEVRAPSVDFLYRDGNHDVLPFGKVSFASTEFGEWMCGLLDIYLADPAPPRIRVLDDLIRLIIGGSGRKEGVGISDFGIVVIDTDGRIAKNDTLKSTQPRGDAFESKWSTGVSRLADVVLTPEFERYHSSQRPSSPICAECSELAICGGGMPTHRWSAAGGLANPTVFCSDQKLIISRIREWISAHARKAA